MSLDKLVERIRREAFQESEEILSRARNERDEILKKAKEESKERYRRELETVKLAAEGEGRRRTTTARLEAGKALLQEKQELLDEVFDRTLTRLLDLPRKKYIDFLVRMIMATGEVEGLVLLSAKDRDGIGEELVRRVNKGLAGADEAGAFTLSDETRDIKGGFILRTGNVEINSSFRVLLDSMRDELEPAVVELLFGGDLEAKGLEK